jgi:membrane protease YdiL (CAAX protease family)
MQPWDLEQRTPFWTWKDILYVFAFSVPLFICAAFFSAAILNIIPGDKPRALSLLVPQFAGFALTLIPITIIFRIHYDRPLWQSVNFALPRGEWLRSLIAGVGLAAFVLCLGAILKPPRIPSPMQDLMDDPASAPYLAVAAVTLAPLFEELFFRGLLQPLVARDTGAKAAIFLSALPFALLHGPEYGWSWRHVVLILIAGVGFGWKRFQTNSTGAATVMHAGYNAVITTGYLLGRKLIDV